MRTLWRQAETLASHLVQRPALRDAGFQASLLKLRHSGLIAWGCTALLTPFAFFLVQSATAGVSSLRGLLGALGAMAAVGAAVLAASPLRLVRRRPVIVAGVAMAAIGAAVILSYSEEDLLSSESTPMRLGLISVVTVFLLTLHPLAAVGFGLGMLADYFALNRIGLALGWLPESMRAHPEHLGMFSVLIALSVGLSAVLYRRTYEIYASNRRRLEIAESLRQAQFELTLSENAATLSRFAAGLTHELNSPLGVIRSALQTVGQAVRKISSLPPQRRAVVEANLQPLLESAGAATERISAALGRLQRLTNLDRAELCEADLNRLVQDVAAAFEAQCGRAVRLDLADGARARVRPQEISSVLLQALQTAYDRPDAEILLRTRSSNGRVRLSISDSGPARAAGEAGKLFEPAFQVQDHRVVGDAGPLFQSREIIRRHGGEMTADARSLRIDLPSRF